MKTLQTLVLVLVTLAVSAGLGAAQQKSRPATGPVEQPATREQTATEKSKADPGPTPYTLINGTVTGISTQDKTFTIAAKGRSYKFAYRKSSFPYKVGDAIQLWVQIPAAGPKGSPVVMGTNIPHCASGDPLKGLNVHKSASSEKGAGPGCVPF